MNRTLLTLLFCLALAACEQEMVEMPRQDTMEQARGAGETIQARQPVAGTVARDADLSEPAERIPEPPTRAFLQRGQERFTIFCVPCHNHTGDGDGIIVQRGFPAPPSYHNEELINAPDRHFFNVITNGYGVMYPFAAKIPRKDRWAIVAYIRTLQYARRAPVAELSRPLRSQLDKPDEGT